MKTIRKLILPLAIAGLAAQPAMAGPQFTAPGGEAVSAAFVDSAGLSSGVALLSETEMSATQGRFAPLGLALAIAGVDIALMGVFWGVYVPHYGSSGALPENP